MTIIANLPAVASEVKIIRAVAVMLVFLLSAIGISCWVSTRMEI